MPVNQKLIYDLAALDLRKELVGKSIVATTDTTIELSDGTILEMQETSDCCAWFIGHLSAFDFSDNIIPDVRKADYKENWDESTQVWDLQIFSAHKKIAEINIEGDETSGYYCHSINLRVTKPSAS